MAGIVIYLKHLGEKQKNRNFFGEGIPGQKNGEIISLPCLLNWRCPRRVLFRFFEKNAIRYMRLPQKAMAFSHSKFYTFERPSDIVGKITTPNISIQCLRRQQYQKMSVPQKLLDLTERFHHNRESYCSTQYNETQLRREFVDPFFALLGWDVDNKNGYAEAYKDVIHEDAIKIGGFTKAPDYCFRIGGTRKKYILLYLPNKLLGSDYKSEPAGTCGFYWIIVLCRL